VWELGYLALAGRWSLRYTECWRAIVLLVLSGEACGGEGKNRVGGSLWLSSGCENFFQRFGSWAESTRSAL
jgi:hypothetical protein